MTKKKFISADDYNKSILPDARISFATVSPYLPVSFPPNQTLFGVWYGNPSFTSGASLPIGTLEVARRGEGTVLIDFDSYTLHPNKSYVEIEGPLRPPYHWSSDLPIHLKSHAPKWINELIESEKRKRK